MWSESIHFPISIPYFGAPPQTDTGPAQSEWRSAQWRRPMSQKSDQDNRSNQLNENNDAYWQSRGYDERPDDWEERANDNED